MSHRPESFSVTDIGRLLHGLGRRLATRGVHADIYVFGGSAVAMAYDARRTTADIDAYVRPAEEVYAEARAMAEQLDLPSDWLSSAGAGFLPNLPDGWSERGRDFSGVRVSVADPRTLIAMKMLATRARDVNDLVVLYRAAGVRTPQDAVAIFRDVYPDGVPGRGPTDEDLEIEAGEVLDLLAQDEQAAAGRAAHGGDAGRHWVRGHLRRGTWVEGFWRDNPTR